MGRHRPRRRRRAGARRRGRRLRAAAQHGAVGLGLARPRGALRARRGRARQGGRAPHLRREHGRPVRSARLPARAGPPVADGADAPHRPGPPLRDLRRAHLHHRRVPAHARPLRPCRARPRGAAAGRALEPRGLRARRQCLPHATDRLARAAPAARVPDHAAQAGAVASGRQRGRRQADGAQPLDQPRLRDDAARACRAGPQLRGDRGPDAARRGCPDAAAAGDCPALSSAPAGRAAAPRPCRALRHRRHRGRRRLQQLGGVGRAHPLGQAAARQRSAPAAGGAVDLVPGAPGAAAARRRQSCQLPSAPRWPACR